MLTSTATLYFEVLRLVTASNVANGESYLSLQTYRREEASRLKSVLPLDEWLLETRWMLQLVSSEARARAVIA